MNENEQKQPETEIEPEAVRVYMDELPPVTIKWAMNVVLKILCALAIYGIAIAAVVWIVDSLVHLR